MDTKTIINYLPIDTYQQFIEAVDALKSIDDPTIKGNYYYALAVMSRVSTCVSYLNMHSTCPYTEEDLLSFMMYSCMLIDSIKLVLREFGIEGPEPTLYYFKDACLSNALFTDEKKYPTDDKFFEYFRSLTFAHPLDTNRAKFLEKGERHYSPRVIVNYIPDILDDDVVGARVYSNKHNRIITFEFQFDSLKTYIKAKYNDLNLATEWARSIVETKKKK